MLDMADDFDLDLFLQCQSSDGDEEFDLADLDRSLEEILNAAEERDFPAIEATESYQEDDDKEGRAGGNEGQRKAGEGINVVEDEKCQIAGSELQNQEENSIVNSDSSSLIRDGESKPQDVSEHLSEICSDVVTVDGSEHQKPGLAGRQLADHKKPLFGEVNSPRINSSTTWGFSGKHSPLVTPSSLLPRLNPFSPSFQPNKPGTSRPGAAVAAAAAASRQATTPHGYETQSTRLSSPAELSLISTRLPPNLGNAIFDEARNESLRDKSLEEMESSSIVSRPVNTWQEHTVEHLSSRLLDKEDVGASKLKEGVGEVSSKYTANEGDEQHRGKASQTSTSDFVCQSTDLMEQSNAFQEEILDAPLSGQPGLPDIRNDALSNEVYHPSDATDVLIQDSGVNCDDNDHYVNGMDENQSNSSDNDANSVEDIETTDGLLGENSTHSDHTDSQMLGNGLHESPGSPNPKTKRDGLTSRWMALDVAEEAEKRAAFSGLHLEEGAAAQPMRLEGIQRGPPAIGFLHIDSAGPLSQALASPAAVREHGTGQALAVHSNYIAVGLSKGTVLVAPSKNIPAKIGDTTDAKVSFLNNVMDKSHAAVTSMSFNIQGDLLLVGHSNGSLVLWDVPRAITTKVINGEHNAAIVHTLFLGQDLQVARHPKAISADCKGLVLLHTFTVVPLLRRFSVTTQCLLDGQRTGMVLSLSPLLPDEGSDNSGGSNMPQPAVTAIGPTGLGSMMGGMVGGVVAGKGSDAGRKFLYDGASSEEAGGVVVFVTHQTILVVRLAPSLEVYAKLSRPDGIRDGAIPYTAWRRIQGQFGVSIRGIGTSAVSQGARTEPGIKEAQSSASGQGEIRSNIDDLGDNENQPLLALAWDKKIFMLQLSRSELKVLVVWNLDSVACGIAWLEEQMVVVLTSNEKLCLFTKEGLEVERASIKCDESGRDAAITYHTHILNSFGNPEKTYHSSLAVRAAALYLLGPVQLWKACLLPWQDRIKALQNAGDWMGAFHIAMEVYDGRTLGVIGLPRSLDALREAVIPTLLELLFAYMDEAFTYLSLAFGAPTPTMEASNLVGDVLEMESVTVKAKEQYARVGGVAIEFCVHIGQTHVLFDRVFNKFCSVGQRGTFLELLEPYILKDMLGGLAPEVMQALVEHYSQRGWLQRVEQCVLHMDIASLDFNQVVRLCRENGLYSALIYLFNKGLDDFKSPLEELLVVAQDMSKPNAQAFGYKMLVYLKYCFSGLAFPPGHGHISPSRLPTLRAELLHFLLDDKIAARISGNREQVSGFYTTNHLRLSYLLSLDLQATLEILHCAFPEDGPLGIGKDGSIDLMLLTGSEDVEGTYVLKDGRQLIQDVTDALTDILERMISDSFVSEHLAIVQEDSKYLQMSKDDVGYIIEFIAQYVAARHAKVSRVILARIVDYLTSVEYSNAEFLSGKKDKDAKRKESLLVSLLRGVPESELDSARTLELAVQAQYWQASACLFAKKGDYVAALDSHLNDREQPQNLFMFILDVLNQVDTLSEAITSDFRKSVLAHMPELFQLSSGATLLIILKHFSKEHKLILLELAPYPVLLFQYLQKIMDARSDHHVNSSTSGYAKTSTVLPPGVRNNHAANAKGRSDGFEETFEFLQGDASLSELLQSSGLEFTDEMAELYVELLCQFEPKSVLKFLEHYENYRLEHCLKLCQDYGITDAAAFLLERVGDIGSALSLVLSDMDLHIHEMDKSIAQLFTSRLRAITKDMRAAETFLRIPEIATTNSIVQVAIELCQRNTLRLDPVESETLWFRLLDRFVEPLRNLHNAKRGFRRRKVDIGVGNILNKASYKSDGVSKWKVLGISAKAVEVMRRVLVHLMGEIVNGMMGYIPLPVIMEKLLLENGYHEFGDFKSIILEILASYGYEQAILSTAKHLVEDDTFHNISILKKRSSQGYAPQVSVCCICSHGLYGGTGSLNGSNAHDKQFRTIKQSAEGITDSGKAADNIIDTRVSASSSAVTGGFDSVMIFFCGHAAHCSCICQDLSMTNGNQEGTQSAGCPLCAPKRCLMDLLPGKRIQKYIQRT